MPISVQSWRPFAHHGSVFRSTYTVSSTTSGPSPELSAFGGSMDERSSQGSGFVRIGPPIQVDAPEVFAVPKVACTTANQASDIDTALAVG